MTPKQYLDELLNLPWISTRLRPQVSRDGKWVAWTWFGVGTVGDVFIAPTDASTAPQQLSSTAERTLLISWTPDSSAIIVAQDTGGDERFQLLRIDRDRPLQLTPLTEEDPHYFIHGGDLHPNGRWLIYGANFDVQSGEEIEPTWIYRHDLETGERTVLARPREAAYIRPNLSPDGNHVLYTRSDLHPAGEQVWLVDSDGQHDREILNFGADVKTSASWFPDGRRLLVVSDTATHKRVGIWALADESLEWIVDDPHRAIEHAFAPHGASEMVIEEVNQARVRSTLLDPRTGAETAVEIPSRNILPLAPVAGGLWIGQLYSSRQPDDIVLFTPRDPALDNIATISSVWDQTALTPQDLTQAESFHWTSVDGLEIQGWLYRPQGETHGTVVYVHGGPTSHSEDRINAQLQLFVRAGFAVLDPNYRGSTGFGLSFRESIKEEGWGGLEQEDIRSGIQALIAAGIASEHKVGITGTSYGGYSTWCAITRFAHEIIAAAAPICGMTDLVVDYETTRPDLRPYSAEMMGGTPTEIPEKYHERSPINYVSKIRGRLLIVQGSRDPNVSPENVRVVRKALNDAGIEHELLAFEDEGHGISRTPNKKTLYLALLDFFNSAF